MLTLGVLIRPWASRLLAILAVGLVGGCAAPLAPQNASRDAPLSGGRDFAQVVAQVEPVAEAECRARLPQANCDFAILVERDPEAGINAFQTLDQTGRPLIIVTAALSEDARNRDELAFVLGHEAAHHIEQHLPQQVESAREAALVFGVLAELGGADDAGIRDAVRLGASVGARRYSQDHELEADALGTVIAFRAGYDPVQGALFFRRLPDPGNQLLGTHPPNAEREAIVRRTAAELAGAV